MGRINGLAAAGIATVTFFSGYATSEVLSNRSETPAEAGPNDTAAPNPEVTPTTTPEAVGRFLLPISGLNCDPIPSDPTLLLNDPKYMIHIPAGDPRVHYRDNMPGHGSVLSGVDISFPGSNAKNIPFELGINEEAWNVAKDLAAFTKIVNPNAPTPPNPDNFQDGIWYGPRNCIDDATGVKYWS